MFRGGSRTDGDARQRRDDRSLALDSTPPEIIMMKAVGSAAQQRHAGDPKEPEAAEQRSTAPPEELDMAAKKKAKQTSTKPAAARTRRAALRSAAPRSAAPRSAALPVVRQGDKAAFVRELSRSMAASEVVERAAALGMVISKAYVHNIRSAANKAARALMAKEGRRTVKGPRPRLESQFRELVVALGPARCKKLLSQVETSLAVAARR
jgi:hypothetical protein